MTKKEIGKKLKELRLAMGKTQKEVAEQIGRKQQIIGHWETGYSQPDANTLFQLCEIYEVSVNEAFGFGVKKTQDDLSEHERKLIESYRKNKDIQSIIDTMLNINNSSNGNNKNKNSKKKEKKWRQSSTSTKSKNNKNQQPDQTAGLTG